MAKVKGWGIIGASTIARQYMVNAINCQPDSRVVALMSRSGDRARRFAEECGIPRSHDSVEALVSDAGVDVVYICTTNERHKAETLAAASRGRHVLCEKPLALTLEDAREMADACKRAGVVMGTNHHLRNAVTHRALRRLLHGGTIGKPLAARVFHAVSLPENLRTWRIHKPTAGAGVILDVTVHDTDTLRFVLDDEVEEVSAVSASQGLASGGVEDAVMGVMRFSGGTLAQFHDAFTVAHAGTGMEIHGTEGSLIAEEVMTQRAAGRVFVRRGDTRTEVDLGEHEDLYTRAVRHFNRAVDGAGKPAATAEDGIRSLAVALAALESARTGRRTPVRYA